MKWFTADLHFGHTNVIKYCNRPFADVAQMNAALMKNWNDRVAPDDEILVLGDLALGKLSETLPALTALNGRKWLIPGNHDKCWQWHENGYKHAGMYEAAGFRILSPEMSHFVGDREVLLSHFPYVDPLFHDERYLDKYPADEGKWLLHGHVHGSWQKLDRMINVGVDVWDYAPVSVDEVKVLMT